MERKEIEEKIKEGALRVRIIIEIVGWPADNVSKSLNLIVNGIKKQDLEVLKEDIAEPKKITEKAHSAFVPTSLLA